MGYKIDIKFSSETTTIDPKYKQVVIAGQPVFLSAMKYGDVKEKLAGKVNEEVQINILEFISTADNNTLTMVISQSDLIKFFDICKSHVI